MQDLAVVIVNYRTPELTLACVASLASARAAFPGLRAVVVDGGSADGSAERIAEEVTARGWGEWVTPLPVAINGGFGFGNNRGIAALAAAGPLPAAIALINPDARVLPGALEAMAALLDREPRCGAVGAQLVHEDGARQASAFHFPTLRSEFCRGARTRLFEKLLGEPAWGIFPDVAAEVPWVTGAAVMFRTEALWATGVFDEGFFLYFEEMELMQRLHRAGWTVWSEPAARIVHANGASTGLLDPATGKARRQRLPRYWYESRRRFFALTRGRPYALASGLIWFLGRLWWRVRQIVFHRPEDSELRAMGDMIDYGLWPARPDGRAAAPPLDAAPSVRPAWMSAS